MKKQLIIVAPNRRDEWSVVEVGIDRPWSRFCDKGAAIDYALALGKARSTESQIKICNRAGSTEAEFNFAQRNHSKN